MTITGGAESRPETIQAIAVSMRVVWQTKSDMAESSDGAIDQRTDRRGQCRSRYASAVGVARPSWNDRNQVRLRYGPVWRVHRAYKRASGPQLCHASIGRRRQEDHNH